MKSFTQKDEIPDLKRASQCWGEEDLEHSWTGSLRTLLKLPQFESSCRETMDRNSIEFLARALKNSCGHKVQSWIYY